MKLLRSLKRRLERLYYLRDIKSFSSIEGFLTSDEAIGLNKFARKVPKNGVCIEIGCWKGKSTYCIANGLSAGAHITVIDPFDASGDSDSTGVYKGTIGNLPLRNQFTIAMERLGVMNKISILEGLSDQFIGNVPQQIDLLFIDGDHSQKWCKFDFINYSPLLKLGGFLLLHDYNPLRSDLGPTWVIENIIIPSNRYAFCGLYGSLWAAKRINR